MKGFDDSNYNRQQSTRKLHESIEIKQLSFEKERSILNDSKTFQNDQDISDIINESLTARCTLRDSNKVENVRRRHGDKQEQNE